MPSFEQKPVNISFPDPTQITTPEQFSQALQSLRSRAGFSIRYLAKQIERSSADSASSSTIGGWFAGSHLPTPRLIPVFRDLLALCGETDPQQVADWLAAVERVRTLPGLRPSNSASPFRGLAAYRPEDAPIFCGRTDLISELVDLVVRGRASASPVIVVGPSGSGKSSLLQAGLIPAMTASDEELRWTVFAPGADPVGELGRQFAALAASSPGEWQQRLRSNPESCARVLCGAVPDTVHDGLRQSNVLVVVDQFEEVFTLCTDETERRAFVKALCAVARGAENGSRVAVVIGMRADFYGAAARFPDLLPVLQDAQFLVRPMSRSQLRQAIIEPVRQLNLHIDDGLVELLLRDLASSSGGESGAAHDPGALPLLSHALHATWQYARGRTLTIDHYTAAGNIQGAVAKTADDAYSTLETDEQRDLTRLLFLRLVQTDDDSADTRRRVKPAELFDGRTPEQTADLQRVLDCFVSARLVTVGDDGIEITHEAILRAWPRLTGWLDADRSWLRLHRRLATAARGWDDADEDAEGLYRGTTLAVLREWVEERGYRRDLSAVERRFFDHSISAQAERARREKLRLRRRSRVAILLAVLAVIAASVLVYASQLRAANAREQAQANSRYVAAEADRLRAEDPSLSMQLALVAYRIWQTPEARSALLQSSDQIADTRAIPRTGKGESVATTQNGQLLAVGTNAGAVELWTVGTGGRLVEAGAPTAAGHQAIVAAAFSANGRLLAAGGEDGLLFLLDTTDPARPRMIGALSGPVQKIYAVAMSPDGSIVAAGTGNGQVCLWSLRDPNAPVRLPNLVGPAKKVTGLAFGPSGGILAAGSTDTTVRVWSLSDPTLPRLMSTVSVPGSEIFSVAISPDGRSLAAGTAAEHSVHLWNIADPARPVAQGLPLTGPASWVNSVAFSPDGRTVAAGSSDNRVWLFDMASRRAVSELPHPGPVTTVRYADDGSLLTIANDGTLRRWRLPGPILSGARDSIFATSFDASGRDLGVAPGANDNTLTVWNVADLEHPVPGAAMADPTPGTPKFTGSGSLTPDGRTFVAGDVDGSIQVWDIADRARPRLIAGPAQAATDQVEAVTLNDGGTLAAICSDDGTIRLLDLSDRSHPRLLSTLKPPGSPGLIYEAAFSHNGRLLAMASNDHQTYLWSVADRSAPKLLATLGGFTNAVYAVSFNPGDDVLAAGGADGTVRLWNVADPPHPVAEPVVLKGPVAHVYSIAFERHSDELAVGSTDGTVWLWDLTDPAAPVDLATLEGAQNGVLTVSFSPDGHVLAAGGHDAQVRLWLTDPDATASWICAVAGQPLTSAEWSQFVPVAQFAPCS